MRILLAAAAGALLAWIFRIRLFPFFFATASYNRARPKPPNDCSLPTFPPGTPPPTAASPPLVLNGPVARGFLTGSTITVPAGASVLFPDPLTLVAFGDVVIHGTLQPGRQMPGAGFVDLVIVSLTGTILVSPTGVIEEQVAADGIAVLDVAPDAVAKGGGASPGGVTKLVAPQGNIFIDGAVRGQQGGGGGSGSADPVPLGGRVGGFATAVGGEAGAGGDVRLCAAEMIRVGGTVLGGFGGYGGAAGANAKNGKKGAAYGGPANAAGFVHLTGIGGAACQVIATGTIAATNGGWGGRGLAGGGTGATSGGDAEAVGGKGGTGASVTFTNCIVVPAGGRIQSSLGGDGGNGDAYGAKGDWARWFSGYAGGNAGGRGGDGGTTGAPDPPTFPTPTGIGAGTPAAPTVWATSKGGDGLGWAGNGGIGGTTGQGTGGPSGTGVSAAGLGGITGTAPPPVTVPAVPGGPAPGGAGGVTFGIPVRGIP